MGLATFMMLVDFAAVSVALPAVRQGLRTSFADIEWAIEAFVVTLAAFVLTAGYIAERRGHRPAFLTGLALFAAGSLVAGTAGVPGQLIGGRVIQGMGGSLIFATGSVLLTATFQGRAGRRALGLWGAVTGLAVAVSPLVGGAIVHFLGWRWLFLLAAPVSAAALVAGWSTSFGPVPSGPRRGRPDWRAAALFTGSLALLVIGLLRITANLSQAWTANGALACFGCAALLLVALLAVEAVSPAPLLDLSLFRRRTFFGSAVAALGLSAAVWGSFVFIVVYMSYDLGYGALAVGLRLLFLTGMTLPFVPVASWLDRVVPVKVLICGGLALVAGGMWWMSALSAATRWSDLLPGLVVTGIGLELVNPRLSLAAAATVPSLRAGSASRTTSTLRLVGTASGVALFGALFATRVRDNIFNSFQGVPQLNRQSASITRLVLDGRVHQALGLAPRTVPVNMLPIVHLAFASALHEVLLVGAAVALASGLCALAVHSSDVPRRATGGGTAATGTVTLTARPPAEAAAGPVTAPTAPTAPAFTAPPAPPAPLAAADTPPSVAMLAAALFSQHLNGNGHSAAGTGPAAGTPASADLDPIAANDSPEAADAGPSTADAGPDAPGTGPSAADAGDTSGAASGASPDGRERLINLDLPRRGLRGQVTSVSGEPLAGATITVVGPDGDERARTLVADDGSFAVDDVGEGTYTVVAAAPNFRPAASMVPLHDGQASTILALLGVGSLSGRVGRASDGSALVAEVELHSAKGGLAARCATGQDGRFVLADLIEGAYAVEVGCPGYRPVTRKIMVERGQAGHEEVVLTGLGHLYGAVCGPEGGWLAGVGVALLGPGGEPVAATTTDGAGSYHFDDVPEGLYNLRAEGSPTAVPVVVRPGAGLAVDVTLGFGQP